MNCIRCQYLLWNLPENRCPECGLRFDVTDYLFEPGAVAFCCRACGHGRTGEGALGLPTRRHYACERCGAAVDAAETAVRPLRESASGEPMRMGSVWASRGRVGFLPAFLDVLVRLTTQPAEFFRQISAAPAGGATAFSILCAYLSAAVFVATLWGLQTLGFIAWGPNAKLLLEPRCLCLAVVAIPLAQVGWNHAYGFLIHGILRGLGARRADVERCVEVVAFGSAVMPALLLAPPIGIVWYLGVVTSGIEQLFNVPRVRALTASVLPLLVFGHVVMAAVFVMLYA